jgi:hypothetical protein
MAYVRKQRARSTQQRKTIPYGGETYYKDASTMPSSKLPIRVIGSIGARGTGSQPAQPGDDVLLPGTQAAGGIERRALASVAHWQPARARPSPDSGCCTHGGAAVPQSPPTGSHAFGSNIGKPPGNGAPLRNRTVDLLLTMDICASAGPATTCTEAQLTCSFVAWAGPGLPRIAWRLSPPVVTAAGYPCGMTARRRRGEDGISFEHRGPAATPNATATARGCGAAS